MMPPYYHPTFNSDVGSVDDSSSFGEEEEECSKDCSSEDHHLIDLRSSASNCYSNFHHHDSSSRQIRNKNNSPSRPSKRANVGDASSFVPHDQDNLSMLQPSQVANVAGNSSTHAMKGGQKLIGELYDTKNTVFMNAIL
jgi:hypothetical protein